MTREACINTTQIIAENEVLWDSDFFPLKQTVAPVVANFRGMFPSERTESADVQQAMMSIFFIIYKLQMVEERGQNNHRYT